jgi:hypothetical protein
VRSGAPRVIVVATRRLLDEIIEAAVMAEHDMSAMLPDKAVFVGVAQCQSTNMIVALEHFPVFVTEFCKPICCANLLIR